MNDHPLSRQSFELLRAYAQLAVVACEMGEHKNIKHEARSMKHEAFTTQLAAVGRIRKAKRCASSLVASYISYGPRR